MFLFKYLSLRARFLVAPLLAIILVLIFLLFGYYVFNQHQKTLVQLNQSNLPLVAQTSRIGVLLVENQNKLGHLLIQTINEPDEEKVYLAGRQILNELHDIEEELQGVIENKEDDKLTAEVHNAFENYRNIVIEAIELTTVDANLAATKLEKTRAILVSLNQVLLSLTDNYITQLNQHASLVKSTLDDNKWMPLFSLIIIILMIFLSLLFANTMSRDIDKISNAMIDLSSGNKNIVVPETDDFYLKFLQKSVVRFKQTLIDNEIQRLQLEESLKRMEDSNHRYLTLLDLIPSAIVAIDMNHEIVLFNQVAEELFGYEAEEMLGQTLDRLIPVESRQKHASYLRDFQQNSIEMKTIMNREPVTGLKKNGEQVLIDINLEKMVLSDETLMVAAITDITERKRAEEKIWNQAHFDHLTQLPNRFYVINLLKKMLGTAQRNHRKIAVVFIDLDDFKKVNDSLGHDAGDLFLIEVANKLKALTRSSDVVGRLGGDEFILLLDDLKTSEAALGVLDELIWAFRKPIMIAGHELITTLSIGVSIYPDDGVDSIDLLKKADMAMYKVKQDGRNSYVYYTDKMNEQISRRLAIEEQLSSAVELGELEVYFQPQFDSVTHRVIGAEALIRWQNKQLGWVTPDEFIPLAEQTGQIHLISNFVLSETLKNLQKWMAAGLDDGFTISINYSPVQFRQADAVQELQMELARYDIDPKNLVVEITEGVFMSDQFSVIEHLKHIKEVGIAISVDDFGTGYSSLSYLQKYPFDSLKIDRAFIENSCVSGSNEQQLVKAMYLMGNALGMSVVAEGVETKEQLDFLAELGVDVIQGFYLGKPVPAKVLETEYLHLQG